MLFGIRTEHSERVEEPVAGVPSSVAFVHWSDVAQLVAVVAELLDDCEMVVVAG